MHTTLAYLPHAKRVLVVGGGDGGTVTQLVKYPNLVEIVWVEIDEQVIQFAKDFFPRQAKALQDLCAERTKNGKLQAENKELAAKARAATAEGARAAGAPPSLCDGDGGSK